MRRIVAAVAIALCAAGAFAAQEEYQMTGPIIQVDDTKITLEKDKVTREFTRDASTTIKGDLKVGAKATVFYKLVAISAEVKDSGAAAKPAEPAPTKPKAKK